MKTIQKIALLLLCTLAFIACNKPKDFLTTSDSSGLVSGASDASGKPNIILILADDVGYEIPNYTGGQSYSTPNLNSIAASGLQFSQCYTAPLCSPSRFMLLTGKYNFRNYTTWGKMGRDQHTIANLLKKAGYATCIAGKWQLDGGDTSIHRLGFDKYLVTNPFFLDESSDEGDLLLYKDPQVYENGAYWSASAVKGKYGEDLFRDYIFNFIDSNKDKKPFFIYWPMNLVHKPFSPTPDDPEFATWNPHQKQEPGDSIFFPSMVRYMDKLIGQLITKLQADKLQNKTLILFLGDNGTTADKYSLFNGQVVKGGKSSPIDAGTHVPMIGYMPGQISPGITDTNLISSVDYLGTISAITKTPIPTNYGTTDGINFAPQLKGIYTNVRPWVFCHFIGSGKNETNPMFLKRWMNNQTYKQYDTVPNKAYSDKFYNKKLDPLEKNPIAKNKMTADEKALSQQYMNTMKTLH